MVKDIVLESQINDLAIIKINRPEVLNALDKEVAAKLYAALDIANIDPIEAERYATLIHNLLNKIENLEKPVIAAINGYALGGGCQLALACDMRIASSNAKVGQTEK